MNVYVAGYKTYFLLLNNRNSRSHPSRKPF